MTKGMITKSMLDHLEYDQQSKTMTTKVEIPAAGQPLTTPTAMFVFHGADLNAAAHHLTSSLKLPLTAGAIASVFVQESVLQQFIEILTPQLPQLPVEISNYGGFKTAFDTIKRLNAKTLQNENHSTSSLLVYDLTHEHLCSAASGIVTVHTFRTAKEAIALFAKETLTFENATIWNENHSCAYELVAAIRCHNFFVNCNQVSLEPLKAHANTGSFAAIEKSYHYETLNVNGAQKNVVFPIGTIFAN